MTIKKLIERIIELREHASIHLTLLAVCPNSDAVLEAAVKAAARNNAPMLFAATLNQVDLDGGYTGWTPAQFVSRMRDYAAKYEIGDTNRLYPCLDHGGQWLKDVHTRDKLTFEQTTQAVKTSITAMLEAGYQLLHIDPTIDRTISGTPSVETVVERSLALIAYAEHERLRLGLEAVDYEVGTEEVHGGLVDVANFEKFLSLLREGLSARNLDYAWPAFVVAQVGTNLHTTIFDKGIANKLYKIVAPYGALVKGHYTDWVENPEDYPLCGMGGANVGPEFTADEFDALMTLAARETDLCRAQPEIPSSRFLEALTQAVDNSNRWQKWLQADEKDKSLDELSPERRAWMLKTCARYSWTAPEVVAARQKLYANLQPIMGDPHQVVVDWITTSIERYITAFHLFNAQSYFA